MNTFMSTAAVKGDERRTALSAMSGAIKNIGHRTSQEAVKESLRAAILSGELPGGTVVVLTQISEKLGTSQTPVREALRELSAEGLIDFGPFRSPVVHQPTLVEAEEIYQLRLILEPAAVREGVKYAEGADLDFAESLCEKMETIGTVADWVLANREFHAALGRSVRSARMRATLDSLRDASMFQVRNSIVETENRWERANAEHRSILDAYRNREEELAVGLTLAHLQGTIDAIRQSETLARTTL